MKGLLRNQITIQPEMHTGFARALLGILVVLQLVACGGGSATGNTNPATDTTREGIAPGDANTGSISLRWTAPVTRSDGTPMSLAEIDGFYIYYGTSEGNYPNRIQLQDGSAQEVVLHDFPAGTYYLVMTTYDVNGYESGYSRMVQKVVL